MFEGLKAANEKIASARKDLAAVAANELKAGFAEVLAKYPDILEIRWTQYTPSFNDGDPCEFGVHDYYVKLASLCTDENRDNELEEYPDDDDRYASSYGIEVVTMKSDVKSLFSIPGEDAYESAFGDHAEIVATREGFTVEECSHD